MFVLLDFIVGEVVVIMWMLLKTIHNIQMFLFRSMDY